MMMLAGKVAVVTGSSHGLGRAFAMALAKEGASVVVNGRVADDVARVVTEIKSAGGRVIGCPESVTTVGGGQRIIQSAIDGFGRLDILINNAGIVRDRMIFNMTPEDWDEIMKIHLYGHYNCTKPACVLMRQQGSGCIINISSGSGLGNSGQANYSAAKEGIIGFTRTVARDIGRYGVTCNAIRPGAATRLTMTEEVRRARQIRVEKGVASIGAPPPGAAQMPVPTVFEMPEPEDAAPFIVWLAANAAKYNINGYDFAVRGGHVGLYSQPTEVRCIDKLGRWTIEELDQIAPLTLVRGLVNPSPPQPRVPPKPP